ncbi:MAG: hypothetical protein ACFE9R_13625 [Candidatus Hermodarchaeota archaeon]
METKTEIKKETKTDLVKKLNQFNSSLIVSRAIKNKYVYPDDMKDLKSTDKQKKSYRRQLQRNILNFLSIENPTKEQKNSFADFCKLFIINFNSLDKIEIDNLYSFHDEKEKNKANEILKKYKQIK